MKLKEMKTLILQNQNDFDIYFDNIKTFCRDAIKDCSNSITRQNMDYVLWKINPASLLNRLYIRKSFLMLTLIYNNDVVIGLSGVELYNKDVALIGRRLFVLKKYRKGGSYHNFMLEPQLVFIKKYGFKLGIITINEYKKNIVKIIKRAVQNKASSFENCLPKYSDFIILDTPIKFNDVIQYILAIYTKKEYQQEKILEKWLECIR